VPGLSEMEYPVKIANLKKSYGKVKALRGISFEIAKGEIFGFLGPNGAGKSTAMNVLLGLLQPTSGSSSILGESSSELSPETRRKIGVVFEYNNLYRDLTGRENLEFYASLYQVERKRIGQLLELLSLAESADRRLETYSKGMKQRLLLLRALLADPEILILDEPTGGLDPQSVEIIHQVVEDFRSANRTVFLASHFMAEVERLCSRIAFLNQGEIVTIAPPDFLKKYYGQKSIAVKLESMSEDRAEACRLELREILSSDISIDINKNNNIIEIIIPLEHPELGFWIDRIRKNFPVGEIHSREASLHQVFISLAEEQEAPVLEN